MATELSRTAQSLYETDYACWLDTTAVALRQENWDAVDWENLVEEIEDMGRRERRQLESNCIVLMLHLLKWQFQPDRRSNSWRASIVEHRQRIYRFLRDSPSLKVYLESVLAECYSDAVEQARAGTGLPQGTFPVDCPFALSQLMDKDYLS